MVSLQPCSFAVSMKMRLARKSGSLWPALTHSGKHFGCAGCSKCHEIHYFLETLNFMFQRTELCQ